MHTVYHFAPPLARVTILAVGLIPGGLFGRGDTRGVWAFLTPGAAYRKFDGFDCWRVFLPDDYSVEYWSVGGRDRLCGPWESLDWRSEVCICRSVPVDFLSLALGVRAPQAPRARA